MSSNKRNSNKEIVIINPDNKDFELVKEKSVYVILYHKDNKTHKIPIISNKFILLTQGIVYCCILINGIIHLFILNKTNTDELKHITHNISDKLLQTIKDNIKTQNLMNLIRNYNTIYIKYIIDFNDVKDEISIINTLLKQKNLSVNFDYMYNINGNIHSYGLGIDKLILCLMKKSSENKCNNNLGTDECVASIQLDFYIEDDNAIATMYSFTKPSCERRSYNTLLRSILITILHLISVNGKKVNILYSNIANKISAWLLVSSYHTTCKLEDNPTEYKLSPDEFKGIRPNNIFNNVNKPTSNINKKRLQTNKKSKKNTSHNTLSGNKIYNIMKNVELVLIDVDQDTETGLANIEIAKRKLNEFITKK